MTVEKKGKRQEKRPHGADHMRSSYGGENRIELVPQRTHFEGAERRANDRESRMQEVI